MPKLIKIIDSSIIELEPVIKGDKIISYSIWLSQGSDENPTEYFIPLHDIDKYIDALTEAKDTAKNLLL